MASLLENVKAGLTGGLAQAPELGAQQQIQTLAQASTGKAGQAGKGVPKISEIGQQQAAQETMAQQRLLQVQQQDMAGQLAEAEQVQEQQQALTQKELTQQEIQMKSTSYQKLSSILTNFEQNQERLKLSEQKASAEQAGFLLRFNNEKYIDKLRIEGRKNRLNTQLGMKEALMHATMREERVLLENDLSFKRMMGAQKREFREELENIDLQRWMEMLDYDADVANEMAKYKALGDIMSTSSGTIASYKAGSPKTGMDADTGPAEGEAAVSWSEAQGSEL